MTTIVIIIVVASLIIFLMKIDDKEKAKKIESWNIRLSANELKRDEIDRITNMLSPKLDRIDSLNSDDFKKVVVSLYSNHDFELIELVSNSHNDVILVDGPNSRLFEVKKWDSNRKLGRSQLQKFSSVMKEKLINKGVFVTNDYFSHTAYEYSIENNIELVDGAILIWLLNELEPEQDMFFKIMCLECGETVDFPIDYRGRTLICKNGHAVKFDVANWELSPVKFNPFMCCPVCKTALVLRKGPYGEFWGCFNFPKCYF